MAKIQDLIGHYAINTKPTETFFDGPIKVENATNETVEYCYINEVGGVSNDVDFANEPHFVGDGWFSVEHFIKKGEWDGTVYTDKTIKNEYVLSIYKLNDAHLFVKFNKNLSWQFAFANGKDPDLCVLNPNYEKFSKQTLSHIPTEKAALFLEQFKNREKVYNAFVGGIESLYYPQPENELVKKFSN